MQNSYFKAGTVKVICDRCGFAFHSDELQKTWDGLMVCAKDYEPRHIADFIKAPQPSRPIPYTRPEATDAFVTVSYISESTGVQETTIPDVTPGNAGTL